MHGEPDSNLFCESNIFIVQNSKGKCCGDNGLGKGRWDRGIVHFDRVEYGKRRTRSCCLWLFRIESIDEALFGQICKYTKEKVGGCQGIPVNKF